MHDDRSLQDATVVRHGGRSARGGVCERVVVNGGCIVDINMGCQEVPGCTRVEGVVAWMRVCSPRNVFLGELGDLFHMEGVGEVMTGFQCRGI